MKKVGFLSLLFSSIVCYAQDVPLAIPAGLLVKVGINSVFVAQFALFLGVLLLWTIAIGKLLKVTVHLPMIAGQIIAGIILGPSFINIAQNRFFSDSLRLFDAATGNTYALAVSDLFIFVVLLISATLTVSYLLWIAGHETDIADMLKVGVTAVSAGILGALVPIAMTAGILSWFCPHIFSLAQSTAIGLAFAATSVSIPVAMLFAYNKMHLRSSKATLGAAIVDDIFAVVLLSLYFIILQTGLLGEVAFVGGALEHRGTITSALIYMFVAFGVISVVGYFVIPPVLMFINRFKYGYLFAPVASGIMLFYFAFSELVGGLAGITGAYFAGLFHRMGDKEHHAERAIAPFVNAFLLPLFLGSIGLQIDISVLSWYDWSMVVLLLVVAILSKLIGCYAATGLSNISGRRGMHHWSLLEGYLFGSAMVARGEVGLVVATILNGAHIITPQQYVITVVVIILTTIAAPIMLSIGFAMADKEKAPEEEAASCTVKVGPFKTIGTIRMFNIILRKLEDSGLFKTSIQFSEGRKIANLQGYDVEIILCPEEGIVFKGKKAHVDHILKLVQAGIEADTQRLTKA